MGIELQGNLVPQNVERRLEERNFVCLGLYRSTTESDEDARVIGGIVAAAVKSAGAHLCIMSSNLPLSFFEALGAHQFSPGGGESKKHFRSILLDPGPFASVQSVTSFHVLLSRLMESGTKVEQTLAIDFDSRVVQRPNKDMKEEVDVMYRELSAFMKSECCPERLFIEQMIRTSSLPTTRSQVQLMAEGLRNNSRLKELRLGNNMILSDNLELLFESLGDTLERLSVVSSQETTRTFYQNVIQGMLHLSGNTTLKSLDFWFGLSRDKMSNADADAFVSAVKKNYSLAEIPGLQTFMDEDHRATVNAILRLNRAGRAYLADRDAVKSFAVAEGAKVLSAVRRDLDCIYLHLLENPLLCTPNILVASTRGAKRRRND